MTEPAKSYTIEQLQAEGAIQLAVRSSEQPAGGYVPSQVRQCSTCDEDVTISNGAFPLADRIPIVCTHCYGLQSEVGFARPDSYSGGPQ